MAKRIHLGQLVLEVTRRCNLSCAHCLRGDTQNVDMQKEIVDKLLDMIGSIGSITFTGGEPALNIPIMEYVLDGLKRRNIALGGFFIATNGIPNQRALVNVVLDYLEYADELEMCEVAISRDVFHDNTDAADKSPLNFLSITTDSKNNGDYRHGLLRRGRAASADFDDYTQSEYQRRDPIVGFSDIDVYQGELSINDTFYVAANGVICTDCDLAYDEMDFYSVGTVENLAELFYKIEMENTGQVVGYTNGTKPMSSHLID